MTATVPIKQAMQQTGYQNWHNLFQDISTEHGYQPLEVNGRLPKEITGTYYQNGPGVFSYGQDKIGHAFMGTGLLRSVRINNGAAEGAVRLISNSAKAEELQAGRRLYDEFGFLKGRSGNRWRKFKGLLQGDIPKKNQGNTNIILWQDKLLALYEIDLPTQINIENLETIGATDLDGVVDGCMSAHPHWVSDRKCGYNFGLTMKGPSMWLNVYELPSTGPCRKMNSIKLNWNCYGFVHDFIATSNHLIFFIPPVEITLKGALDIYRGKSVFDSAHWRENFGTEIIIVPIDKPNEVTRFKVDPFFPIHFSNAFEENGKLFVDYMHSPDHILFSAIGDLHRGLDEEFYRHKYTKILDPHNKYSTYRRIEIDPQSCTIRSNEIFDLFSEFPRLNPACQGKKNQYTYCVSKIDKTFTPPWFQQLVKYDAYNDRIETYVFGDDHFPSEPIFIRKPNAKKEDEGYLLMMVLNAQKQKSYTAILDAQHIEQGPLATINIGQGLPISFHGNWVPGKG